jgi:hypothetical protein
LLQWFGGCMFFVARANVTITDSLFKNGNAATAGKER